MGNIRALRSRFLASVQVDPSKTQKSGLVGVSQKCINTYSGFPMLRWVSPFDRLRSSNLSHNLVVALYCVTLFLTSANITNNRLT
jgi:hypothetical protein